ncbi:beta-N-acetylhexosaminidase [Nisaea acidiphila]|uniref:beta-N-acetylhexosaminidase n=1 Tax=Nisaea acidiphila TaxID=1862145 RepID=A0A9J7AR53_9PROT|nr:beta-N-acetylhexosaminidase [Nisaea acidiphila]UUX50091.1 beta-N-acetylhexosaminidase [Nisaea acidiphila]
MRALILGCAGPELTRAERQFFVETEPFGFILFQRNCENVEQLRRLTEDLRDCVGHNAPILIDQEGGRVQRLKPPLWRKAPPASLFGELYRKDPVRAEQAVRVNARLIAAELTACGIDVDCLPLLDVRQNDTHDAIGDRSFGYDVETVSRLGRAQAEGLAAGGVGPVMKHIPGHGRARVDSHFDLPRVDIAADILKEIDFAAFKALAGLPMAMTGHVVYEAIDPDNAATLSSTIIWDVIRTEIGFDGLLMTDDISMKALGDPLAVSSARSIEAGCDLVLHCNGNETEMREVAEAVPELSGEALRRAEATLSFMDRIRREAQPAPMDELLASYGELTGTAA